MADADRMNMSYVKEETYGVIPVITSHNPTLALTDLRYTSESIAQITGTVNSAEIRSDRQIVDHIRTTINVAGDMNIELSYGAFDDFLEWGLLSAVWTTEVTNASDDLDAAAGDNSFNSTIGGFSTDTFVINRWIKSAGFATAVNNGFFRIVSVTDNKIVVTGGTLVTDGTASGPTLTQGSEIKNDTTQSSFVIEKEYTDLTSPLVFARYTGCMVDTFTFTVPSDNIVTGSFGILGKIEASAIVTLPTLVTKIAAPANEVMAGIEDITAVMEPNSADSGFASTQFSITLANNLRQRLQIGTLGPISVGSGTVDVTGTLQAYFDSVTIIDKHLNFTDSSLAIQFADSTGKGYVIDLPRVNYDSANRVASGQNTDILADMTFSAFRNSTQSETIVIQRFTA